MIIYFVIHCDDFAFPNVSETGLIWSSYANISEWKIEIMIGDLKNLPVSIDKSVLSAFRDHVNL